MNRLNHYKLLKRLMLPFYSLVCILIFVLHTEAQERPPRPIRVTVNLLQQLNFGSIIPTGTSGSVTVTCDGGRTSEGHVLTLGMNYSPARFSVDAEPGTYITIINGPPTYLSSSNGRTLRLELGEAKPGNKFVTSGQYTDVTIGGKLIIGSILDNPGGFYSGTFQVTFIQE